MRAGSVTARFFTYTRTPCLAFSALADDNARFEA